MLDYAKSIGVYMANAINIYVPYVAENFGGLAHLLGTVTFIPTGNY
ncbi:MAG: hypothetical protein R2773_01885 [Flavobacteriaceae bacterium]